MNAANILVVDDNPNNLRLLSGMLIERGFKVRPVPNGKFALSGAQASPPDVILLDINMPDMDGYEVCTHLKANPKTADIPVIFITAYNEVADKVKAFEVGGVDYITKPFQFEEVLARVKNQLTIRQLQHQLTDRINELQTLNERFEQELNLAQKIQQGLLRTPHPDWPIEVVCFSQAAREVGGDFYSYAHLPAEDKFVLIVGDISGKGASAALLMAASLSLVDSLVPQSMAADDLLKHLDGTIAPYAEPNGQNCALCYVELTGTTMRVVNAGCIPPYIRRTDGTVDTVEIGGFPLGLGFGLKLGYAIAELDVAPGDLIIMTSDGLVEAGNSAHDLFGFDRFTDAIATGPQSPQAMLTHLKASVDTFQQGNEPHDDITVIIAQV